VATPPEDERRPSGRPGGRPPEFPLVRAILVLALFVVATVLLLGVIHPKTVASTAGTPAAPGATTTTTTPGHPATTTTTIPPSKVSVLVANATQVSGAAADIATELKPGGWNLLPPVDATVSVPASQVYYVSGYEASAQAIATSLHLTPSAVVPYTTAAPITTIGTAQVLVVVGPDLANSASSATTSAAG
jgi:hypothetical protein